MNDTEILHYASPYYDPVKAHEYYMRTRELKGRRSTSNLDDEGKKIWSYTKNQIKTEKKGALENEKTKTNSTITQLRANAEETKARINEKLEQLKAKLSAQSENDRASVSNKTSAKIEEIKAQQMPSGLTKRQQQKWMINKKKKIQRLQSDADKEKKSITTKAANEFNTNKSESQAKKRQVSAELKSVISATREAYKSAKVSINETYEQIYDTEYSRILAEHTKTTTRRRKQKRSSVY